MTTEESREFELRMEKQLSRINEWMDNTDEHRRSLGVKIDSILLKLEALPCKERSGYYSSIQKQLGLIWTLVCGLILSVIGFFIKER